MIQHRSVARNSPFATRPNRVGLILWLLLTMVGGGGNLAAKEQKLASVSCEPTEEFYHEFDLAFAKRWQDKSHGAVAIQEAHDVAGDRTRAAIESYAAEIVAPATAGEIDAFCRRGRYINANWRKRLPGGSAPFTSAIVFVARKGNPKRIKDWPDLIQPNLAVVMADAKVCPAARWQYLAAWSHGLKAGGNDPAAARDYLAKLFRNIPIADRSMHGSVKTFARRGVGDVLVTWESDAVLLANSPDFEVIARSSSILVEPPVTLVDKVADRNDTRAFGQAYLEFLYSEEAQTMAMRHGFRPRVENIAAKQGKRFANMSLSSCEEMGGWSQLIAQHFAEGGVLDEVRRK